VSGEHIEVGAYALGLLEAQDTAAFEAHLATCESCRAEFAELSPMKALLTGLGPVDTPDDVTAAAPVTDLLHRRAQAGRRRTRRLLVVGAAAAAVAAAAGVAGGLAAAPSHPQQVVAGAVMGGQEHSATDPRTGVRGTVGLLVKGWGTWVTLDLANVRGPLECELVAVSKTGETRVVTGWNVAVPGDGVPGHPAHLLVAGGTSIPLADLSRFEVIVVRGPTLLTIPVSSQ
jgi:hypothetical protein